MSTQTTPSSRASKQLNTWWVLLIALALALALWLLWAKFGMRAVHQAMAKSVEAAIQSSPAPTDAAGLAANRAARFSELGQVGDSFGALNTLLTAIAGALVFWAGFMQHRALRHAQDEAQQEREARAQQAEDMLTTIRISERSAKSAEEANQLARDSYIASQRAWVKVEFEVGPLTYDQNGLNVTFVFHLINIGNTPALRVEPTVELRLPIPGGSEFFNHREVMKELAERDKSNAAQSSTGFTIFPGERITQQITTGVPRSLVDRATEKIPVLLPQAFCIASYQLVQGDGKVHQTAYAFSIQRIDTQRPEAFAANRSQTAIFPDDGDIPRGQLALMRSFIDPGFAD